MAKTQTRPWDPAEHLETEEDMGGIPERRAWRRATWALSWRPSETSPAPGE